MAKKKGSGSRKPAKKGGGKGKKGKKEKKKPLSKREMEMKKREKEKLEQEAAAQAEAEARAKQRKHEEEMAARAVQLVETAETISFYDKVVFAYFQHQKRLRDWKVFTACRNLPDFKLNEINSYLTNWEVDLQNPSLENVFRFSPEILQLIEEMKEFLQLPLESVSTDTIYEIGLLYHMFKEKQRAYLDDSTYEIIQDLSEYYDPEEGIFDLCQQIEPITFAMYGNIFAQPDLTGHNFEKLKFKFKIPENLVERKGVFRLVKTEYDHLSDSSSSYFAPGIDNALRRSILDWERKKAEKLVKLTDLKSPEEPQTEDAQGEGKKGKKDKKGKKGKKGSKKKKKGSKKGKKGSGKGSKKGGGGTTTDTDGEDEYQDLDLEDEEESKTSKKKKKKGKSGKKGKKGKKGKAGGDVGSRSRSAKDVTETSGTDDDGGEADEDEYEGDEEEGEDGQSLKKQFTEADFQKKETREERRARRRQLEDDADKMDDDDDFDMGPLGGGAKGKGSDSDSDEEKKPKTKKEKREGDDQRKLDTAPSKTRSSQAPTESKERASVKAKPSSKSKKKGGSKKGKKGKKSKGKKKKKKKSKGKKGKRGKKGKKGGKKGGGGGASGKSDDPESTSASQSRKGKSGGSKDNKKGKGGKGKGGKSKSESRGRSKTKGGGKGAGGKSKSGSKGSKGSSKSKSGSKGKSKSGSRGRSKEKKKKGKGGSKSKSKSKSKSGSRKGSKSKKGKRSRSKSKGKKKKKSKSKERQKTEAELAKERERAEKAQFIPKLLQHELNLRNYAIMGGVYHFNWLETPPQPKERGNWILHEIEPEQILQEIPFEADFVPPTPPDMQEAKKTPEEMEREAKKQEEELQKIVATEMSVKLPSEIAMPGDEELDEAEKLKQQEAMLAAYEEEKDRRLDRLVQVEIDVPRTALWFEPPIPVRWDAENRVWSTQGFYDIKFNEDQLHLCFRTTAFGIIGFGHNRFSNLPYQSFELKPAGPNKCIFSLMAAMTAIEFTIHNDLVCVSSLQNVSNSEVVEAAILNKYLRPRQLIKALRYHGLDVFPELDSYAYVDGILLKHIETEEHLYQCMAILAPAYNFHWSRWNLLAGRERIVFQMRERLGATTPGNYQMVLSTPLKCALIQCTEVSPNFSDEPVVDSEYHADLLHLTTGVASDEAKTVIKKANAHFIETVRTLVTAVRPISFS